MNKFYLLSTIVILSCHTAADRELNTCYKTSQETYDALVRSVQLNNNDSILSLCNPEYYVDSFLVKLNVSQFGFLKEDKGRFGKKSLNSTADVFYTRFESFSGNYFVKAIVIDKDFNGCYKVINVADVK